MKSWSFVPRVSVAAVCGVALLAGCTKHSDNTLNYRSALDNYYSAHPVCLWPEPMKFPVEADTSDASKTASYDALVDQGLLVRTTAEKTKMIVMSKQVNHYDISDSGRSSWTADPQQPGFGNFCYGHRKVTGIDNATPTTDEHGATTQVSYHVQVNDAPGWATAAETQNAYPNVKANVNAPQAGQATLVDTNDGWKVERLTGSGS
jgi:hypothetical protein